MDKYKETQAKFDEAGKKAQKMGWILTLLITIPVILFVLLGVLGAVIGGIVVVLVLIGLAKSKKAAGQAADS